MNRILSVTEFKAQCLARLTEVEQTGGTITLTRRGRPIAVVGPAKRRAFKSPAGSFEGRIKIVGDIVNIDTADLWNVVREGE